MAFTLKSNTYITLQDAAAWLKLKVAKVYPSTMNAEYDDALAQSLIMCINAATTKVESYTRCNILKKTFKEQTDGNNSNVIVPTKWPILKVTYVWVDSLRRFGDETKVDVENWFLRGGPDNRQVYTDVDFRIIGQDIVMRDSNERYILGQIFLGSALGSIQIQYDAGWANDVNDVPSDIMMATLQLMEFYYFQRDNRDIGVISKGVKGESYSKTADEIPKQIIDLLDSYVDHSFGAHPVPQRNTFVV